MALRVSVVIPALNEAHPVATAVKSALVAGADEVVVADGGSRDGTREVASQSGASVLQVAPSRGGQLRAGASQADGDVLLFLHADNWLGSRCVEQIRDLYAKRPTTVGGCFRQAIDADAWTYRLLETGNAWRARWLRLPYGDQAVFLAKNVLREIGGVPDQPLMEDVALARAMARRGPIQLLEGPVHVSARRWKRHGVVRQTLSNWMFLASYLLGASPERLARRYRRHDE